MQLLTEERTDMSAHGYGSEKPRFTFGIRTSLRVFGDPKIT